MKNEPLFKNIFGKDWKNIPAVMHKHYANRPYTNDVTRAMGKLDIACAGPIKYLSWLFWRMHSIPPCNENNVPVEVIYSSEPNSKFFCIDRIFHFGGAKPYHYKSRMVHIKKNEVIEVMSSRIGWHMNYVWESGKVKLKHVGYVLHLFGYFIPLPLTFLIGEGNAEETAIDDNFFDMIVRVTHPWWGLVYEYKGRFELRD